MSRQSSWEGDAAAGLLTAAVLLTIFIVMAAGKVALVTLKEIGRVYVENTSKESARLLWYALGGLFGLWLISGVVAAALPAASTACAYTAAWSFLAYVVAIEVVDWLARPSLPRAGDRDSLDTYLGDFANPKPSGARSIEADERAAATRVAS
jgi:hypothetical protein